MVDHVLCKVRLDHHLKASHLQLKRACDELKLLALLICYPFHFHFLRSHKGRLQAYINISIYIPIEEKKVLDSLVPSLMSKAFPGDEGVYRLSKRVSQIYDLFCLHVQTFRFS